MDTPDKVITYEKAYAARAKLRVMLAGKSMPVSIGKEDEDFVLIVRTRSQSKVDTVPIEVDGIKVKIRIL